MTTINRNKKHHLKVAVYGLIGLFVSVKSIINNFNSEVEFRNYLSIVLVLFLILMLIITTISVLEIFKSKIAIEISQRGIIDKVSFVEAGFIELEKITEVFIDKIKGKDHLIIKLVDGYEPEIMSNFLKKPLIKETKKKFGNAISISKDYVEEDLSDIMNLINIEIQNKH